MLEVLYCMVFENLRRLRICNNMTTKEVSEKVGISKSFYCQIENCKKRLTYENAIKISEVFNVSPDELFYDDFLKNCLENNVNNV